MADKSTASAEWSADNIKKTLEKQAAKGGGASANVFFEDSVSADQLSDAATDAITRAAARVGKAAAVEIERVHRLAKCVSVKGDPDVIAELSSLENVKSILPSEIEDVYPKPVRKKIVE